MKLSASQATGISPDHMPTDKTSVQTNSYSPQRQSPRYEALDAWRGIACLLVIVFHTSLYASVHAGFSLNDPASWFILAAERMWIGVPFFFVISGYCIAATADANRRKGIGIRSYFARRISRIFPPYLICLAISIPVTGVLDMAHPQLFSDQVHGFPWRLDGWQIFGNLTLTEGWRYHLFGSPSSYFLGHAWTLGYEEQFYAVSGLLLFLSARRFFLLALLVSLATVLVMRIAPVLGIAPNGFFFNGYWLVFTAP